MPDATGIAKIELGTHDGVLLLLVPFNYWAYLRIVYNGNADKAATKHERDSNPRTSSYEYVGLIAKI